MKKKAVFSQLALLLLICCANAVAGSLSVEDMRTLERVPLFERFNTRTGNFRIVTDPSSALNDSERPFVLNLKDRVIPSFVVIGADTASAAKLHSAGIDFKTLRQCQHRQLKSNFLSTHDDCEGQSQVSVLGYVLNQAAAPYHQALFRCFNPVTNSYRVSPSKMRCLNDGYHVQDEILGYAKVAGAAADEFRTPGSVIPPIVGFGATTTGGRGGTILHVTNLNDDGDGSLRKALQGMSGKRVIVFDVAGTITMSRKITVNRGEVTVLGETAPSPGITLEGASISIQAPEVIIRHLRVHVGDRPTRDNPDSRDGISISANAHNVIVDHNTVAWAMDEGLSTNGVHATTPLGTSNVSVTSNLVAEGLYRSVHPHGIHSMSSIISAVKTSYIGNVFTQNNGRNPRIDWGEVEVIGNLYYDYGGVPVTVAHSPKYANPARVMIVNNRFINGPETRVPDVKIRLVDGGADDLQVFFAGNQGVGFESDQWGRGFKTQGLRRPQSEYRSDNPLWNVDLTLGANDSEEQLLSLVGARPYERDATEKRVLNDILQRSGRFLNTPPADEFAPLESAAWLSRYLRDDGFRHYISSRAGDANEHVRDVVLGIVSKEPVADAVALHSCTIDGETQFILDDRCKDQPNAQMLGYVHLTAADNRAAIYVCRRFLAGTPASIKDTFLSKSSSCENNGDVLNGGKPLIYLDQPGWAYPTLALSANPPIVQAGQKSNLVWYSENTRGCQITDTVTNISTPVASIGTLETNALDASRLFTFTCIETTGVSEQSTQTVRFVVQVK